MTYSMDDYDLVQEKISLQNEIEELKLEIIFLSEEIENYQEALEQWHNFRNDLEKEISLSSNKELVNIYERIKYF